MSQDELSDEHFEHLDNLLNGGLMRKKTPSHIEALFLQAGYARKAAGGLMPTKAAHEAFYEDAEEMRKSTPQLLTDFIEGLNEAIGAAGVMIHHHQDLRWHFLRQILEETKNACVKFAVNPLTAPKAVKHEKKTQILVP